MFSESPLFLFFVGRALFSLSVGDPLYIPPTTFKFRLRKHESLLSAVKETQNDSVSFEKKSNEREKNGGIRARYPQAGGGAFQDALI